MMPRGQHLLNHAQAEREAKIEPHRVTNDLGREAIAGIAGANGRSHPLRLPALLPICKPARAKRTVPFSFRCLRFASDVAASHARLASGWRAAPLLGGGRTLWI